MNNQQKSFDNMTLDQYLQTQQNTDQNKQLIYISDYESPKNIRFDKSLDQYNDIDIIEEDEDVNSTEQLMNSPYFKKKRKLSMKNEKLKKFEIEKQFFMTQKINTSQKENQFMNEIKLEQRKNNRAIKIQTLNFRESLSHNRSKQILPNMTNNNFYVSNIQRKQIINKTQQNFYQQDSKKQSYKKSQKPIINFKSKDKFNIDQQNFLYQEFLNKRKLYLDTQFKQLSQSQNLINQINLNKFRMYQKKFDIKLQDVSAQQRNNQTIFHNQFYISNSLQKKS